MLRIILAEIKDISLVKSSYGFRVNHSGNAKPLVKCFFLQDWLLFTYKYIYD